MQLLHNLMKYSWIIVLPMCLASFAPLALNAGTVGGIPSWAYWSMGMAFTAVLFVLFALSSYSYWRDGSANLQAEA